MKEYHKIVTVWERDPQNNFKTVIEGAWATPEFEYLRNSQWAWTEKIDGTNVRVMWDGEKVTFGGKTDNAQLPTFLFVRLQELFTPEKFQATFDGGVCLYGEGYGAKIQKGGGNYNPNGVDFCLFDVRCGEVWLERSNVEDIGKKLSIDVVPIVSYGTLSEGIKVIRDGLFSRWGEFMAEGLVMRPMTGLLDRRGHRIITKIKHKDFLN